MALKINVLFYMMDIPHIEVVITDTVNYIVKINIFNMCNTSLACKRCSQWRNATI